MPQHDAVLSRADLEAWLAEYKRAWERKDGDAAGRLFTADGRYFETPFSAPFEGPAGVRAYWERVTADQQDIEFRYEPIAVDGNMGVASWTAKFVTIADRTPVELAGVFVLDFDDSKRCVRLREWWHLR